MKDLVTLKQMATPSAKNKNKENINWGSYLVFKMYILIIFAVILLKMYWVAFKIIIFNGKSFEFYIIVCPI